MLTRYILAAFVLPVLLLAVSCAPLPRSGQPSTVLEKAMDFQGQVEEKRQVPPPSLPETVAAELLPPASMGPADPVESSFDVEARHTPAQEFFSSLVAGTPYSMVVHPEVTGEITLALKSVTIEEVLQVVKEIYGFPYRSIRGGFQVYPAGMQSRVYHVNYLNLIRQGKSQTQVSSGQVSDVDSQSDGGSGDGDGELRRTVSGSRIETESQADFWSELSMALNAMIGREGGRHVVIQPHAGVVVVRATAEELNDIEAYLSAIQGNLQRQVILEAKILEVELSDGFQSGINWSALFRVDSGNVTIGQTGGGTIFDNMVSEIAGNAGKLVSGSLPGSTDTSAFGGVFSAALEFNDFSSFIELLETQGDVQVLSSPRISTINNQKAVIKVGSDEFFVTSIKSTTVTGTATTTTPEVELTPFFSGIALDVTPQIDARGRVTLHIHPTVSQVQDQTKQVEIAGQTQSLPLAFSTVRESDSIVFAEHGQVVVIGGLMQDVIQKQKAGVPVAGQLPLVGDLFSHNKSSARKSELVILVRPLVVQNGELWNTLSHQARGRMQELDANMYRQWRRLGE